MSTLSPAFGQRVVHALAAPAPALLVPDIVYQRLVARLQACLDHRLACQVAALVEVGAGIAEALGLVLGLDVRHGVVAAGDDDALGLRLIDERREGRLAGVTHDFDAVGVGRHGLLELIDHRLLIPLGILLDQLDVVRRRRRPGPVGARRALRRHPAYRRTACR